MNQLRIQTKHYKAYAYFPFTTDGLTGSFLIWFIPKRSEQHIKHNTLAETAFNLCHNTKALKNDLVD